MTIALRILKISKTNTSASREEKKNSQGTEPEDVDNTNVYLYRMPLYIVRYLTERHPGPAEYANRLYPPPLFFSKTSPFISSSTLPPTSFVLSFVFSYMWPWLWAQLP